MKQYKTYIHIYGTLKGKRKESMLEIDMTGVDILSASCPVKKFIKEEKARFKNIRVMYSRQYGYRESDEMIFRDLFPTNEYLFDNFGE